MKTNITGRIICAGRLVDNNGAFFDGLMIECELSGMAIRFYREVSVMTIEDYPPFAIDDEKKKLIDHIIATDMTANNCRAMIETITIVTTLNK